ncbi:hypothetical protein [Streptomyces bobili]
MADMVCGNIPDGKSEEEDYFKYRSSSQLTQFFADIETDYRHDGTTRKLWVAETLEKILSEPHSSAFSVPGAFARVVARLMDREDAENEGQERLCALKDLNRALARDGLEAFYADDGQCYLRHVGTNTLLTPSANPHRPLSSAEVERREQLASYLDRASEDELIEEVLLPLFRQLGYHRITAAGHRDKALEYGKDVWMRFTLPTQHVLYFGIQAKKGKLDSSGVSRGSNANVAEIYNQVLMMLGHEIFDPEIGKRVLVDHAFIVAGGTITKAARAWLGNKLDASKRSQILFMDRDDILNLFVVTNLPLPESARPKARGGYPDEPPF